MEVFLQTRDALERVDIETYTAARERGGDKVTTICDWNGHRARLNARYLGPPDGLNARYRPLLTLPVPQGWQLLLQIHVHLLEHLLGFDELLFCLGWRGSGVCQSLCGTLPWGDEPDLPPHTHSWYPLQSGCEPQGLSRIEARLDVDTHPEHPTGALGDTLGIGGLSCHYKERVCQDGQ